MIEPQGIAFVAIASAATCIAVALACFRRALWETLRSDGAVRAYARLVVVIVGVWIAGSAASVAARGVVARLAGGVSQFQTTTLVLLAVCLVILMRMAIRAAR
ncbi:MAG: hypothetical protein ACRDID_24660 [Ktedonobacterales bacterium]